MNQQTQINEDANEARAQTIASEREMLEDKITVLIKYLSNLGDIQVNFGTEGHALNEATKLDKQSIDFFSLHGLTPFDIHILDCPSNRLVYKNGEPVMGYVLVDIYLSEFTMALFKEFSGYQDLNDNIEICGIVALEIDHFDGVYASCLFSEDFDMFTFDDKTDKILRESYGVLNSKLDHYMRWIDYLLEQFYASIETRSLQSVVYESCDVFYHVESSEKFRDDRVLNLCMLAGSFAPALRLIEKSDSEG